MIPLEEDRIIFKGRLGPGKIIGVHLDKGKIYDNNDIKNYLSKEYKDFYKQIIISIYILRL